MEGRDTPIELEVVGDEFIVTPALAKLLLVLARRHLEREQQQRAGRRRKENVA